MTTLKLEVRLISRLLFGFFIVSSPIKSEFILNAV